MVGDLIYRTAFSYFALNDVQGEIAQQSANIVSYRAPSYGMFTTTLEIQYWFGVPRNVSFAGLSMDMDYLTHQTVDKHNNNANWINYNKSIGSRYSAMEHLVPEQMFSTDTAPAEGVSAVKALALASAEGQRIYTITQNNVEQALNNITLNPDTETEIRNAAYAGKEITTHQYQINFNTQDTRVARGAGSGWIGEGYIIIDPETGAGAYKIAGGGNGSFLYAVLTGLAEILALISLNNGLVFGARIGLIPLLVSGPIGWGFTAALGVLVLLIGIMFAFTDHGDGCTETCDNTQFMHALAGMVAIGAGLTLLTGGFGALIVIFIMLIMLARFMAYELVLSNV